MHGSLQIARLCGTIKRAQTCENTLKASKRMTVHKDSFNNINKHNVPHRRDGCWKALCQKAP